jgi:tetratricopeptide (TPR) repeat protein
MQTPKKTLTENDYTLISPKEALKRFQLKKWFEAMDLRDEDSDEDDEERTVEDLVTEDWGGNSIALYDGDTIFSEEFNVGFAVKKQGDDYSKFSRKIIINGNFSAPKISTSFYSFLFINGDVDCHSLSTEESILFINGNLRIKNDLRCFAEDHETTAIAKMHVTGKTTVPYILTWYYQIPKLNYTNAKQIIAIHSGFENDKHTEINQIFHREIPLYLKTEFLNEREKNWSDEVLFKSSQNSGEWLINEYIKTGTNIFKNGISLQGLQSYKEAHIIFTNQEFISAKQEALLGVKLSPHYAKNYYLVGQCLEKERKYDEALVAYKKAFEIDACEILTLNRIALCYCNLKEYNKTIEYADLALKESAEMEHTNSLAYRLRGEANMWLNNEKKALQDFNLSIQGARPVMLMAYYFRGMIYYKNNSQDKAKEDYEMAKSLSPTFDKPYYDEA